MPCTRSTNATSTAAANRKRGCPSSSSSSPPSFWSSLIQKTDDDDKLLWKEPSASSPLCFLQNEWKRVESFSSGGNKPHTSTANEEEEKKNPTSIIDSDGLPHRFVDFFCIVGSKMRLPVAYADTGGGEQKGGSADSSSETLSAAAAAPCEPILLSCYPSHRPDMEFPQQLPSFCFPTGCQAVVLRRRKRGGATIHHNRMNIPEPSLCQLVLTSAAGNRLYLTTLTVYERMLLDKNKYTADGTSSSDAEADDDQDVVVVWAPKVLVLMSHYAVYHQQSTILKELYYTIASGRCPVPFERFVAHIMTSVPFPSKKSTTTVVEWKSWTGPGADGTVASFRLHPQRRRQRNGIGFCCDRSLEPLFRTVSLSNILSIWGILLQEGRVVLRSKHVALLTPVSEALMSLLYPLTWQGIYVPVLPTNNYGANTIDILDAPVPYLIGLPSDPKGCGVSQPLGVTYLDLDNDVLHLGYNEDGSVVEKLPKLPDRAIIQLKVQLEEIADPLYLPTINGIKGQMTIGDGSATLDNAMREPYAQRTRLFQKPSTQAFSRSYVLSQSAIVPPRGRTIEEFILDLEEPNHLGHIFCCLAGAAPEEIVEDVGPTAKEEAPCDENSSNTFLNSLSRSSRHVQLHTDRLLAVFGQQEYATPSSHASKACVNQRFDEDALRYQDEIAKHFFETSEDDIELLRKTRAVFLNFFASVFSRYELYVDAKSDRLNIDRYIQSMRCPKSQHSFLKAMLTSQMFASFLSDPLKRQQFKNEICAWQQRDQIVKQVDSPMSLLSVPPPYGAGVPENQTFCHDRRFPDYLKPDELITKPPVLTLWKVLFDSTNTDKQSPFNREIKKQRRSHHSVPRSLSMGPSWFLSLLCFISLFIFFPEYITPLTSQGIRSMLPRQSFRTLKSDLLYQSSAVGDDQRASVNQTQLAQFSTLDQGLEYCFQQERLSSKKFNADLHDIAFKRNRLEAHSLLTKMELLYNDDPTNSSLVQPDSLSYTTVIESWCQSRRCDGEAPFSCIERDLEKSLGRHPEYLAATAAQDLLFRMECSQNAVASPLNYLFVCQKWAEIDDSTGSSMEKAEEILDAYKEKVTSANGTSTTFSRNSLAAFYAVLVDGWSRLVGKIQGAFDRAEGLLKELESSCSACSEHARPDELVVQEMREKLAENHRDVGPFSLAYTSFIAGISRTRRKDMGRQADAVLQRMKDNGVDPDMVVYTSVINCWAKTAGRAERIIASKRALNLLEDIENRYISEGNYLLKPSHITYSQAIKAIGYSLDPDAPRLAEDVLKRMYELTMSNTINIPPNVHHYNALITALSTGGGKGKRGVNARKAEKLLHDMVRKSRYEGELVEPNIYTYGAVLRACRESGLPDCGEQAQRILDQFEKWFDTGNSRVRPNVVCYTTVMQAWGRSKASPAIALQKVASILSKLEMLFAETGMDTLRPNQITYITAMEVFGRKCPENVGSLSQATVDRMLYLHDIGIGHEKPTRMVFNGLINAWSKSPEQNAAENAERVFQEMEARYAAGDVTAQPDEVSLCSVLNAWANRALEDGALRAQQIMDHSTEAVTPKQRGFELSVVSWNVLIKAWGRSRAADAVQRAEKILVDLESQYARGQSLVKPDITTYSSVINCCAYYSGPAEGKMTAFYVALRTFDKIKKSKDLTANNIVYGTLFKAIGKLQKGGKTRDNMIEQLFGDCCKAGQVSTFSLSQLQYASPERLYRRLVLEPCLLSGNEAGSIESTWRKLPHAWKRNVVD